MKIQRAYRVELAPTVEQARYLERASGVARFAYNWALAEWRRWYRWSKSRERAARLLGRWRTRAAGSADPKVIAGILTRSVLEVDQHYPGKPSAYGTHARLTKIKHERYPWMAEVTAYAVREAVADVGDAYANFFRRLRKHASGDHSECGGGPRCQLGEPRFHARAHGTAFHCNAQRSNPIKATLTHVQVPGLGMVRMKRTGYVPTDAYLGAIAIRRIAGRWFASVRGEVTLGDPTVARVPGRVIGIEVGVRSLAVTSSGRKFGAVRDLVSIERAERRLKLWSRRQARRWQAGKSRREQSHGWHEAVRWVQHYYAEVARCRADLLHKTSRSIVDLGADTTVMRDMAVKSMIRRDNKRGAEEQRRRNMLAPMVAKVGMYELRRQVEYKQKWAGGVLVVAPSDHPTTRTCSACGLVRDTEPGYPAWTCDGCLSRHDREENAAKNLRIYSPPSGGGMAAGGTRRQRTARKSGTIASGTGHPVAAQTAQAASVTDGPDGSERETAPALLGPGKQARKEKSSRGKRAGNGDATAIPAGNSEGRLSDQIVDAIPSERFNGEPLGDHGSHAIPEGSS